MERKVGFEHTLTKQMSLVKYLTEAYPKEYTIVDSKYILPNKVEITYSNIVPVIVGINPNNFGIPETRKTIKKAGTYFEMAFAPKDTKKIPTIPSWAEFTGHILPLNEYCEGYEYTNKEDVILTEKFSVEKEEYEIKSIVPRPLQRKRVK